MPDHADRLNPKFFAKVVGRDRSAAGGDQVQYDPLERLPVADTPGDDQVAADDPVVQPQHRPGPACLNGFGQRAARHVVGDGLRTSFFVRESEKLVVGERFEPSRDEEAGYPVRPHVLLDAEQGGQRDGGDDLDALRGLFAQERQPAGRAVHFVQQQDAFARVADQAVELRNNKVCYMTACDSLKHTAVFRSVGCRAAIPPVTEEMRVGKSVLAGIVQKGLYLPILSGFSAYGIKKPLQQSWNCPSTNKLTVVLFVMLAGDSGGSCSAGFQTKKCTCSVQTHTTSPVAL